MVTCRALDKVMLARLSKGISSTELSNPIPLTLLGTSSSTRRPSTYAACRFNTVWEAPVSTRPTTGSKQPGTVSSRPCKRPGIPRASSCLQSPSAASGGSEARGKARTRSVRASSSKSYWSMKPWPSMPWRAMPTSPAMLSWGKLSTTTPAIGSKGQRASLSTKAAPSTRTCCMSRLDPVAPTPEEKAPSPPMASFKSLQTSLVSITAAVRPESRRRVKLALGNSSGALLTALKASAGGTESISKKYAPPMKRVGSFNSCSRPSRVGAGAGAPHS
mmetsp:Transcript_5340/g.9545  ORF Transcript_5340/g.9545 Transcript_5340/m.9545 type:complete len:275 (-) Transcript_5340:317-1141(-)